MSEVLQNLLKHRATEKSASSATDNVKGFLRVASFVVIAIAVYQYHEILFSAAQPYVNSAYAAMRK